MTEDMIAKLKRSRLVGRSGGCFPTWLKWDLVKKAKSDRKYVICNASEGEPGVFKDEYILENFAEEVVDGIKVAMETVGAVSSYIYLNKNYYQRFKEKLMRLSHNLPVELFRKPEGYLCGEETVLMNIIEGKKAEPRVKPPFPTEKGLWGKPTLVNNVETLYWANKIAKGEYEHNRFYCVSGEVKNKGVYELPEDATVEEILKETNNFPSFNPPPSSRLSFFVQAGGEASGEILLSNELNQSVKTIGAITVFKKSKTNPIALMKKWARFFLEENCDRCTPCREGIYRINEILEKIQETNSPETLDKKSAESLENIFLVLEKTSLCPLGIIAATPFKTAIEKLLL